MDYGSQWPEPWPPPSNSASYGGAPATHHISSIQPPSQHQLPPLHYSSYRSSYYPTTANPSAADTTPNPSAALPGPDPYLKNPYPARGGYESLYPSAPPPTDTYAPRSYASREGYDGLTTPAAAAAADAYVPKSYAPHGEYDGLKAAAAADTYVPKSYPSRGGYDGLHAPAKETAAAGPPYAPNTYAPHEAYEGLYSSAATSRHSYLPLGPSAASSSSYYGGERVHSLTVKEAIRQYGEDPSSYRKLEEDPNSHGSLFTPKHLNRCLKGFATYAKLAQARSSNWQQPTLPSQQRPAFSNKATHPVSTQLNSTSPKEARRKRLKVTKVMQSAFCEVCKIDCSTAEVLNSHKQGKKHKKNLLKLQEAITAKPAKAPKTTSEKETPADKEDKDVSEVRKKRLLPATEDELEIKKKRVLEGGAAADGIKVCHICNVVVNSQKVLDYHIAGQKHAEMLKKAVVAAS